MLFLIWVIAILSLYVYLRRHYNKFPTLGVNQLPVVPFLGNITSVLLKRECFIVMIDNTFKAFPGDKIVGFYEFMTPVFLINDVELFKNICTKDFEHFVDRRSFPDKFKNTLYSKNLLTLKGNKWKAMRSTLSPAFTGAKIRLMVPFMAEVAEQMTNHLKSKINDSKDLPKPQPCDLVNYVDLETKDMASRCSNDILASCVYGIQVDSTNGDNEFFTHCREASQLSVMEALQIMFIRSFPTAAGILNMKLKSTVSKFYMKLILEILKYRDQHNVVRNDMMHVLKEARKEWKIDYLSAQAVLFLVAGFETVSTGIAFILHELALNPDIQERLHQEIKESNDKNQGNLNYTSVQTLTYLDMVVSEGLRLWPPATIIDRKCVKDYNIGRPSDLAKADVIIRKDEGIMLSIWSVHRNPEYFPEPEKFDPERFSKDNKHKIKPFTYIPFGVGPRNCIGARFAIIEIKVLLYILLLNIEVMRCEKTKVPVHLAAQDAFPRIPGGHWVRIKLRTTS